MNEKTSEVQNMLKKLTSKKMQEYMHKCEVLGKAEFTDDAKDVFDALQKYEKMSKQEKKEKYSQYDFREK